MIQKRLQQHEAAEPEMEEVIVYHNNARIFG